jgi:uncharacterized RDD family membrane protein YckC/type II secretory pathway pseudopilin PulG
MINIQIVDSIKERAAKGESAESIKDNLKNLGTWSESDIDEALSALGMMAPSSIPVPQAVPAPASVQSTPMTETQVPHAENTPIKYAGFWVRYAANIIDGFVFGVVGLVIIVMLGIVFTILKIDKETIKLVNSVIILILQWTYMVTMTYGKRATLGKMAVGVIVTAEDGSRLSFTRVLVRETVGKILSSIILGIGYLMVAFTKKKQGLHDKLVGSVVIHKDPNKKVNGIVIALVVFIFLFVGILIVGILASIVLASLSVARSKSNDLVVQQAVASTTIESLQYIKSTGSLAGFQPSAVTPVCSGAIIFNVSTAGNAVGIFGKSCEEKDTYYCEAYTATSTSLSKISKISEIYIPPSKVDCGQ